VALKATFDRAVQPGAIVQPEKIIPMEFFKILNTAGVILAWIIVLAVIWAVAPLIMKLFVIVQSVHNFTT